MESLLTPKTISVPSHEFLGLRFHALTLAQTLDVIDEYVKQRSPRQISFSNAQTVVMCQRNEELRGLINRSHLNMADGMSIVWGSRILGRKLPERVGGPDLMRALAERSAEKNYGIFLLGSSPKNLADLKNFMTTTWPAINVVGTYSPPMCERLSEQETTSIIRHLRATSPDILFVGISCPKQERWIAENLERIDVPVCLGVGAAFDFLSGRITRAPEWLRSRGLEWMHRLWCEPRRLWRRYLLGNFIFLLLLIRARARLKFSR